MEEEGLRFSELALVGCGVVAGCGGALLSAWDFLDALSVVGQLDGNSPLFPKALSALGWTTMKGLFCLALAGLAAELGRWFRRQN